MRPRGFGQTPSLSEFDVTLVAQVLQSIGLELEHDVAVHCRPNAWQIASGNRQLLTVKPADVFTAGLASQSLSGTDKPVSMGMVAELLLIRKSPTAAAEPILRETCDVRVLLWTSADPIPFHCRSGGSVAVLSSRLHRGKLRSRVWCRALCQAIRKFQEDSLRLGPFLGVAGNATQIYLRHALERLEGDYCELTAWPNALPLWSPDSEARCYLSPSVFASPHPDTSVDFRRGQGDAWLTQIANKVVVLHVRRNGKVERCIKQRLENGEPCGDVFYFDHPELIARKLGNELLNLGATPIRVGSDRIQRKARTSSFGAPQFYGLGGEMPVRERVQPASAWKNEQSEFLTHCTRGPTLTGLRITDRDDLDEILFGLGDALDSPLRTLLRILSMMTIRGSRLGIRGGFSMVGFTEHPFLALDQLRTFRGHRHRWDFEPYAILVRKNWLESHGCRPVVYGDNADWASLPASSRPFYQVRKTSRLARKTIDWSGEREWRYPGDLDLGRIPARDLRVIVPSWDEAVQVARVFSGNIGVLLETQTPTC